MPFGFPPDRAFSFAGIPRRPMFAGRCRKIGTTSGSNDPFSFTASISNGRRKRPQPDFESIHEQLKQHSNLTLALLWEE